MTPNTGAWHFDADNVCWDISSQRIVQGSLDHVCSRIT